MTRRQFGSAGAICCLALLLALPASADPAEEACMALMDARAALVSMLDAKDKPAQDAFKANVEAASAKLDQILAGMSSADAKTAADFKTVWDQFKATREGEIIPAIYAGKADDARKLASGIQAERLAKMRAIISCK